MSVAKYYKPKWTFWSHKEIRKVVIAHKRRARRVWKEYIRTGDIRDFDRASKLLTSWDFE